MYNVQYMYNVKWNRMIGDLTNCIKVVTWPASALGGKVGTARAAEIRDENKSM